MDMFSIFLISAKSNDITNIYLNSILVQKIASTFIYDIIMSPEHFSLNIFYLINSLHVYKQEHTYNLLQSL